MKQPPVKLTNSQIDFEFNKLLNSKSIKKSIRMNFNQMNKSKKKTQFQTLKNGLKNGLDFGLNLIPGYRKLNMGYRVGKKIIGIGNAVNNNIVKQINNVIDYDLMNKSKIKSSYYMKSTDYNIGKQNITQIKYSLAFGNLPQVIQQNINDLLDLFYKLQTVHNEVQREEIRREIKQFIIKCNIDEQFNNFSDMVLKKKFNRIQLNKFMDFVSDNKNQNIFNRLLIKMQKFFHNQTKFKQTLDFLILGNGYIAWGIRLSLLLYFIHSNKWEISKFFIRKGKVFIQWILHQIPFIGWILAGIFGFTVEGVIAAGDVGVYHQDMAKAKEVEIKENIGKKYWIPQFGQNWNYEQEIKNLDNFYNDKFIKEITNLKNQEKRLAYA